MKYACVIVLRVCVCVFLLETFSLQILFFLTRCVFIVDCKQLRYDESPRSLCQVCRVVCEFLLERERERDCPESVATYLRQVLSC